MRAGRLVAPLVGVLLLAGCFVPAGPPDRSGSAPAEPGVDKTTFILRLVGICAGVDERLAAAGAAPPAATVATEVERFIAEALRLVPPDRDRPQFFRMLAAFADAADRQKEVVAARDAEAQEYAKQRADAAMKQMNAAAVSYGMPDLDKCPEIARAASAGATPTFGAAAGSPQASASRSGSPQASPSGSPADPTTCPDPATSPLRVCLTLARGGDGKIVFDYTASFVPSPQEGDRSYHLHLFQAVLRDGRLEPEPTTMHAVAPRPGSWFNVYDPGVRVIDADTERGGAKAGLDLSRDTLLCVRVATGVHRLLPDRAGGVHTGNCLPITR